MQTAGAGVKMLRIDGQIRAMRPDVSTLLSASAGSGKTHVLVRRMIHQLACGAPPESLAAITFTEKAAAQMKDRLFEALLSAAWEGTEMGELLGLTKSDMPRPIIKSPGDILSALASCTDCMKISTIHAFCLGLLRAYPLESGLPAEFSVMDDSEIPIRRESAADRCIDSLSGPAEQAWLKDLSRAGITLRELRALLLLSLGKRGQISKLAADHGGIEGLVKHMEEKSDAAGKGRAADNLLKEIRQSGAARGLAALLSENSVEEPDAIDGLMRLDGLTDIEGLPEAFARCSGYFYTAKMEERKNSPFSGTAAKEALKRSEPALDSSTLKAKALALKERHDEIYSSLRSAVGKLACFYDEVIAARALSAFLRIYGVAEGIYTTANGREGLVDYDDLELHAYMLLRRPDAQSLIARMEQRVAHYLIDEFQDTGELQWGIVRSLASEAFAGAGAEEPLPPTLFAVGDVKQSIYRFRKANYKLMDRLKEEMEESILPERRDFPELHHNFRSSPEVLKVVDETFKALFGDKYIKAEPVRRDAKGSVRLSIVGRDEEPDALAAAVSSALGLPVWDDDEKGFRGASYGDMAVLLRARTGLPSYEEALRRRGIPFKVVGGVGFFYQEEVRALVGLLNYLDNPADFISLAAALKSALFRLTDSEIERLVVSAYYIGALAEIRPDAARLIERWRGMARLVTAGRLVEEIVRDSAALFSFGMAGGPAAVLNVEKLVGLAREFDTRGGVGLSQFTEWARAYREKSELAAADVELPQYRDFVSVMTVHAAKGLEFPAVFMPGMARSTRKAVERLLVSDTLEGETSLGIWTDALMGDNAGYSALKEEETVEREGESMRLLYVAMTRAKDHLVMMAGVKPGEDGSFKPPADTWLKLISEDPPKSLMGAGSELGTQVPCEYVYCPERPEAPTQRRAFSEKGEEYMTFPSKSRLSPLPVPEGIVFRSPSALAPEEAYRDTGAEKGMPYSARLRGVLIHAALERYGREGRLDVGASAAGLAEVPGMDKKAAKALIEDVDKTLTGLLSDPSMRELLSPGPGRLFELPLMLLSGNNVVYGRADLVIIQGDTAHVYDFKSGLGNMSDEEITRMYSGQLLDYCEAVKGAFSLRLAEGFLLLADTGRILSLNPKNL